MEKVAIPNATKLQDTLVMKCSAVDVVGQKAFVEAYSSATQKNGKPYNNRYIY
jgi:ketosteroid isomerase-like protein